MDISWGEDDLNQMAERFKATQMNWDALPYEGKVYHRRKMRKKHKPENKAHQESYSYIHPHKPRRALYFVATACYKSCCFYWE